MVLSEENYIEKINSYTIQDWLPLFDLIPEIEATESFGEMIGEEKNERGEFSFSHYKESPIVWQFQEVVYKIPIIIDFDWGSWDDGREIVRNEDFDYDTIDIPTKCKLITAIVRNDRFCEGALVEAFDTGLIQKILKSLERQLGYEITNKHI